MRICVLFFVLITLCCKRVTRKDLEGTWDRRDAGWAKMRLIFEGEHFRLYHPSEHETMAAALDSLEMTAITNIYRYRLDNDTIEFEPVTTFTPGFERDTSYGTFRHKFIIHKLENDTLTIEEQGFKKRSDYVRIK